MSTLNHKLYAREHFTTQLLYSATAALLSRYWSIADVVAGGGQVVVNRLVQYFSSSFRAVSSQIVPMYRWHSSASSSPDNGDGDALRAYAMRKAINKICNKILSLGLWFAHSFHRSFVRLFLLLLFHRFLCFPFCAKFFFCSLLVFYSFFHRTRRNIFTSFTGADCFLFFFFYFSFNLCSFLCRLVGFIFVLVAYPSPSVIHTATFHWTGLGWQLFSAFGFCVKPKWDYYTK